MSALETVCVLWV